MSQKTIPLSTFRKAFGRTLDRVLSGERIILTNHNKPWVKLVPPNGDTENNITALELRLDIKVALDNIYYSKRRCAIVRKGEIVADIVSCKN